MKLYGGPSIYRNSALKPANLAFAGHMEKREEALHQQADPLLNDANLIAFLRNNPDHLAFLCNTQLPAVGKARALTGQGILKEIAITPDGDKTVSGYEVVSKFYFKEKFLEHEHSRIDQILEQARTLKLIRFEVLYYNNISKFPYSLDDKTGKGFPVRGIGITELGLAVLKFDPEELEKLRREVLDRGVFDRKA